MSTILFGHDYDYKSLLEGKGNHFVIITDSHVEKLIAKELESKLHKAGLRTSLISFPKGEEYKSRATKEAIENQMLNQRLGRDTCIIAIGGGVVTDLAGFVAATYCRGIPFISIPTTLLAMVDASIGGKTAVNTHHGKNMIGAFYEPEAIFINPTYLLTLSDDQMRCGAAEIIKHGLIGSYELFEIMETQFTAWQTRDLVFLEDLVRRNCAIKQKIVSADPKEAGVRKILNFGHTIGHAIESADEYAISHGDAVAVGMSMEAELSVKMGILSEADLRRIQEVLLKYGFSLTPPKKISLDALKAALAHDKKSLLSLPRFVVLKEIGKVECFNENYCTFLKEEQIDELVLHQAL